MKNTKLALRILAIVLLFTVVMIPTVMSAAAEIVSNKDYSRYDLSKPSSPNTVELGAADFIEMIDVNTTISDIEKSYLLDYSYINVKYDAPTSQYVTVTAKDNEVTVSAVRYSYTAANGQRVSWCPISATVDGEVIVPLNRVGETYVGVISGVDVVDSAAVKVQYKLEYEFVIAKDDINSALNAAYNTAIEMKGEYDAVKDLYTSSYADYLEYLKRLDKFNIENEKYNDYLDALAIYHEDLVKYNQYLGELAAYEDAVIAYNKYREEQDIFDKYVSDLDKYGKDLDKYNEYVSNMELVREQLNVLHTGIYGKVTDLERDLYSCMFAGLVDQVVENKDLFVSGAKANPYAIDGAAEATANIRKMLKEYEVLTTDADKYGFYISNRDSLTYNLAYLATCLYDLYGNKMIKTRMHSEGKTEKYVIMISQLVICSNALNGGPVSIALKDANGNNRTITLNKNSTINYLTGTQQPYGNVTESMLAILDGNEYVKTAKTAAPLAGGFPQKVEEPIPPTGPNGTIPNDPVDMNPPILPEEKTEPIEPEKVEKPENVEYMEEPVKDPILDDEKYLVVIEALSAGTIKRREELTTDYVFTPDVTVEKAIISDDNVTVTFYNHDGTAVLSRIITAKYSSVAYDGDEPVKPSTDLYAFYFTGWIYSDGSKAELDSVENDVNLYPEFKSVDLVTLEFYDTDRQTLIYSVKLEKGSAASFVGTLPTKSDDYAQYTFDCWVDENGEAYNLSDSSASAKLYPAFTTVPYIYITFHDADGAVLYVDKLLPGKKASYGGELPTKESDNEADYVFTHWVDEYGVRYDLDRPTESMDLYPSFAVTSYIVVTFHGINGEIICERRILKGVSYSYDGEIPVRDSVPEADYEFIGWVDEHGKRYDLRSPDLSADLYPEFEEKPCAVLKFYDTDGINVIFEARVRVGAETEFIGSVPTKETDSEGAYTFMHWVDVSGNKFSLETVIGSADLYPYFDITPYITVTFLSADGTTVLYEHKVLRGESVSYLGTTPVKTSDPEADYVFSGYWLDTDGNRFDLTEALESVSVYPEFSTVRYIIVNFYDYDRVTLLETLRVRPGEIIAYTAGVPTRAGDYYAEYSFSHWVYSNGDRYNFERLGNSADFYPVFNATPYYDVIFYAEDRVTVLETLRVLKGGSLIGSAPVPSKNSDDSFGYEFEYWTDINGAKYDISSVDEDVYLYPYFNSIPYVTVTFTAADGKPMHSVRVLQGSSVIFDRELPKRDSTIVADYIFDGWSDENGVVYDLSSITSNVTLYPFFKEIYKEYDLDRDYNGTGMTQFTVNLGAIGFDDIPVEHFLSVAAENRGALLIETEEASVRFPYSAVSALKKAGVAYVSAGFTKMSRSSGGYSFTVVLKDARERIISERFSVSVSFEFPDSEFADAASIVYTGEDGERYSVLKKYENGTITFDAYTSVRYDMVILRYISVSKNNPIDLEVSDSVAEAGAVISVSIVGDIPAGKKLELYYFDSNSVKCVINDSTFIMPDGNVTVYASLADIFYTVTFVSDGKILMSYQYKYGETVIVPRNPTKQNDGKYSYTFVGWSEEIGEVTGDATYHAVFDSELLPEDEGGIKIADKYLKIIKIAIIVVAAVLITVVAIIITKKPGGFSPF